MLGWAVGGVEEEGCYSSTDWWSSGLYGGGVKRAGVAATAPSTCLAGPCVFYCTMVRTPLAKLPARADDLFATCTQPAERVCGQGVEGPLARRARRRDRLCVELVCESCGFLTSE